MSTQTAEPGARHEVIDSRMSAVTGDPSVVIRQAEPRPRGSGTSRYMITFACYGAHLHGDETGSVDRRHNLPGSRVLEADPERAAWERQRMAQPPYSLDASRRAAVLRALRNHCLHRGWNLLAAHVRTNHVHAVVESEAQPERIMNEFKSYASRELNLLRCEAAGCRRWARHGSTRWLWKDQDVRSAIRYVVEGQGEPMAVFVAEGL
jgi:REP element-mobilizing transposase RayT